MSKIKISIIIPTFNAKKYLERNLKSIFRAEISNFEIIIVDDASKDGTVKYVKEKFKDKLGNIKIIRLRENSGPARARNMGVKRAGGEILAFLDTDTRVDKNWAKEALRLFAKDKKIGCLQCKLLLLKEKNKIDYAGDYLGSSGFLVQRSKYGEVDRGQYDREVEILAAKSAGMFIRKSVFQKIGGFDEDYFIYVEETDLGWRSWLAGYKTLFCPKSVVYHEFAHTARILSTKESNFRIRFHGCKNYLLTLLKNLGRKNLLLILPKHLLIWGGLALSLLARGRFLEGFNILKGMGWVFLNLPKVIKKRKKIQKSRVISDPELFARVFKKESLFKKINQYFLAEK